MTVVRWLRAGFRASGRPVLQLLRTSPRERRFRNGLPRTSPPTVCGSGRPDPVSVPSTCAGDRYRRKSGSRWAWGLPAAAVISGLLAASCGGSGGSGGLIQNLNSRALQSPSSAGAPGSPDLRGAGSGGRATLSNRNGPSGNGGSSTGQGSNQQPIQAAESALRSGLTAYFGYLDSDPKTVQSEVEVNESYSQEFPEMSAYFTGNYLTSLEVYIVRAKFAEIQSVQWSLGALSGTVTSSGVSVSGCLTLGPYGASASSVPSSLEESGSFEDTWSMVQQNGSWMAASATRQGTC